MPSASKAVATDGRAYAGWGAWRQPDLPDALSNISGCGMTKSDPEREARLAAALRENLRKRKAQARDDAGQKKDDTQPASDARPEDRQRGEPRPQCHPP